MPSRQAALYCDEDVSVVLAAMLRARGFPVTTTRDAGHLGRTDEQQLQVAADANWILLTHNRADFETPTPPMARVRSAARGYPHRPASAPGRARGPSWTTSRPTHRGRFHQPAILRLRPTPAPRAAANAAEEPGIGQ